MYYNTCYTSPSLYEKWLTLSVFSPWDKMVISYDGDVTHWQYPMVMMGEYGNDNRQWIKTS
jgi:hypothetical protein